MTQPDTWICPICGGTECAPVYAFDSLRGPSSMHRLSHWVCAGCTVHFSSPHKFNGDALSVARHRAEEKARILMTLNQLGMAPDRRYNGKVCLICGGGEAGGKPICQGCIDKESERLRHENT